MTYSEIESKITTLQQEIALKVYIEQEIDMNFSNWYDFWCLENNRFNDINESNFEKEEIPNWSL